MEAKLFPNEPSGMIPSRVCSYIKPTIKLGAFPNAADMSAVFDTET